ncbi:MAG: hypothetical protein ABIQ16_03130, partial [Polyangiaceae bacterium]
PEKAGAAQVGSKAQAKAAPAKPAKVEKRSPPSKSASQMTEHERLNAAIGQSMFATPSKAKASKASEYDPLNPKL